MKDDAQVWTTPTASGVNVFVGDEQIGVVQQDPRKWPSGYLCLWLDQTTASNDIFLTEMEAVNGLVAAWRALR